MHWMQHCHPTTQAWHVGKVAATAHVDKILDGRKLKRQTTTSHTPPSMRLRLSQVMHATASEYFHSDLPSTRAIEDAEQIVPLWTAAINSLSEQVECVPVHISLSTHDDHMLRYGRDVPLCALGLQCIARTYPGNQGPLPIYVSPSVQQAIDDGCKPPPFPSTSACLLCIRRDVHSAVLSWNAMVPDQAAAIRKMPMIPPPFVNLVDVPGGYHAKYIVGNPTSAAFGSASIVGVTGEITVRIDVRTKEFYFDQSKLVFSPNHFL